MARAVCRCGQPLEIPPGEVTHLTCPACSAKVRIVRKSKGEGEEGSGGSGGPRPESSGDGFVRFPCPCGRKLKVSLLERPTHGKCPGCGAVVPVPPDAAAFVSAEAPTADLPAVDQAQLDAWSRSHLGAKAEAGTGTAPPRKLEAGLRVCPQCGKPVHMGSEVCRGCGTAVPKR